ncbi:Alpha-L-fucosidase [Paenibacillus konkukensis]|uniref:alpha-L-fucosidase n=1 Tax=Paenibacillus konkukensis TaxID=2020716 RepID=A0ABY4RJN5_9BACL|nr:alpha-L-fucosidase [Paenibacillus konkukensis]UQZ82250.1 Alpha-L-fucosidase [Paenibacillus konkukensis]
MTQRDMYMDNAEAEAEQQPAALVEYTEEVQDRRLAWWREARFGMFIHWGLYSLLGGVWKGKEVPGAYGEHIMLRGQIPVREYEQIAGEFNPVRYNAEEWVKAAKAAGMKYLVITAKHHDGFALYDSKVSDFNIVKRTPYARDPMKDLADACHKHSVKLCFYYSHSMDWHHPDSQGNTHDYPNNIGAWDPLESWVDDEDKRTRYERYLNEKAFPQLKELLTQYGEVAVIWFDCGHKVTDEQGQRFVDYVRSLQPNCLVNRRVRRDGFGDYGNSGDNQLHIRINRKDWESIHTMNNSWGYKKTDHNWKSVTSILRNMIDVFSLNGNYLLNVGPTPEGEFDEKSLDILQGVGRWMSVNGESVYATTGSPIGKPQWGRCTMKGQKLYLHVFDWPRSGKLVVGGLRNRIAKAYLLADPEQARLAIRRLNADDVELSVPSAPLDPAATVIVAEIEGAVDANPLKLLHRADHLNVFGAFDGDIDGEKLHYDTGKAGRDTVTGWSRKEDCIRWTYRAAEPGSYEVKIVYGAQEGAAGGEFVVETAGQQWRGSVKPKGDGYEFAWDIVGIARLEQPGEYTLTVRAESIAGETLMNLKEIQFRSLGDLT